jgi:CubicO group peptidase (beta-lactamase class C family)
MKKILFVLSILLIQYTIGYSQEKAHQLVKERLESRNIPGMAFLIAKDGKIIDEGYYGKANLELDVEVTEKSVFAIASMSKTYTAAAILIMAEQGLLNIDDTIKKYIPEAPNSWKSITIKQLLTHTSGLVDDWALYDWNESNQLFLQSQTDSIFLDHLFKKELLFEPGTDHSYSCGPFVLGVIIERITGEYYEQYLIENIFKPLKLTETFVDHPYKIIPHRVSGYFNYDPSEIDGGISGLGNGLLIAPIAYGRADVGIRTSARDLMKFYNALLSNELLNEASKKLMFEPSTLNNGEVIPRGAGLMNWPSGGIAFSNHGGGFRTGFTSQGFMIPKDNFMVIILTNFHGGGGYYLAKEIASIYYPELESLSNKTVEKDTKPYLTKIHLDFFQKINSIQENENIHTNFPLSFHSKNLKNGLAETESITFIGERDLQHKTVNFFDVNIHTLRFYRLNGDNTKYTIVYLDENDKIIFFDYPETE